MRFLAVLVCSTTLLCAAPARAQRADDDVAKRIAFLEPRISSGETSASRWSWAWVCVYGALSAGNFTLAALTDDRNFRVDSLARGSLSTIGLLTTVALWPASASAGIAPRGLPDDSASARDAKLSAYEASLARAARGDAFGTSWKAHLIGFGVNGLAGALVAFLDERPKQGALVFAGGFLVAEIKIFTRPTPNLRTKAAYDSLPAEPAPVVKELSIFPTSSGATVLGAF